MKNLKWLLPLVLFLHACVVPAQTQRTRAYFNAKFVPGYVLTATDMKDLAASGLFILNDSISSVGDTMRIDHKQVRFKGLSTGSSGYMNVASNGTASVSATAGFPLQTVHRLLSSAEILTLSSVPIQIIAAPGSGKHLVLCWATCRLNFNSIAYATGSTLSITSAGAAQTVLGKTSAFITSSATVWAYMNYNTIAGTSVASNTAVNVILGSNPTLGNSTVDVNVTYYIENDY